MSYITFKFYNEKKLSKVTTLTDDITFDNGLGMA